MTWRNRTDIYIYRLFFWHACSDQSLFLSSSYGLLICDVGNPASTIAILLVCQWSSSCCLRAKLMLCLVGGSWEAISAEHTEEERTRDKKTEIKEDRKKRRETNNRTERNKQTNKQKEGSDADITFQGLDERLHWSRLKNERIIIISILVSFSF